MLLFIVLQRCVGIKECVVVYCIVTVCWNKGLIG